MHLRTSDDGKPLIWISDEPVFDIAMAAYNTGNFIRDAIESVMSQTYTNWHIYIIDDCSKDKTIETIKGIVKKWDIKDKCTLYKTNANSGYGTALKWAIESGEGELIAILDSDDLFSNSDVLDICVKKHKELPNVSMTYSNYCEIPGKIIIKSRNLTENESLLGVYDYKKRGYTGSNINISHLKTFKRGFYDMTIGLDHRLLKAVDKDVILKLEEVGDLYYLPQNLYNYRKYGSSISNVWRDRDKKYQDRVMALKKQMYIGAQKRREEGLLTRIGETYCYSENGVLLGRNKDENIYTKW